MLAPAQTLSCKVVKTLKQITRQMIGLVLILLAICITTVTSSSTTHPLGFSVEPDDHGNVTLYGYEQKLLKLYIDGNLGKHDSLQSIIVVTNRDSTQEVHRGYIFRKKGKMRFQRNRTFEEAVWSGVDSMLYTVAVTNGNHSENVSKVTVQIAYFQNNELNRTFLFEVKFLDPIPPSSTENKGSTMAVTCTGNTAAPHPGNEAKLREVSLTSATGVLAVLSVLLVVVLILSISLVLVCKYRGSKKKDCDVESGDTANDREVVN